MMIPPHPVIFIAGIDTEVGKTIATGYLAKQLVQQGQSVITQKLVQTGSAKPAEDIKTHRQLQGIDLLPEDHDGTTCRYVFDYPCSPHLAAKQAGQSIDIQTITKDTEILKQGYDTVLLEGAGGLLVPITAELTILDYLVACSYPVALVTSSRLGSINHTLLSLAACQTQGVEVSALIYNQYPLTDTLIATETKAYLQHYITQQHPNATFIELPELSTP